MALYFDTKLQAPLTAGNRVYIDIDWHHVFPVLAVALFDDKKGGLVCVHDTETQDTVDVDAKPQPNVQVVCISWHPTQKVLAIGYESGEVVIWNMEENESFEGPKGHNAAVVLITWSLCGTTLVTADNMGSLVNWKSDCQGHLQLKAHHDFKDPVCQVVYRAQSSGKNSQAIGLANERTLGKMTSWRPKTGMKRSPRTDSDDELDTQANERSFFVGLLSGAIYYVRDNGSSEEVLTSGSAVKSLLFHEADDILIVMTEAYILGQFHVDTNGGLNEVNKMKLSGHGDVRVSWVGVGTLAVISEELSVRLWDVASGENMVLEPKGTDYAPDEVFCSLDFNAKSGVLCCCTNKGKLIMWRETAQIADTELGDDGKWEWYNSSQVSPTIKTVKWCQNQQGLLALNGMRDVFILREQELVCYYGEKMSAIQANPTEIMVKLNDPATSNRINLQCDFHVKGITTTATHVCVWSGKKVATYEVGPQLNTDYKLVGTFSSKCITICIHELSLFLLDISEVQVVTFQGTVKQTLNFQPNEGDPITTYIGGEYLTVGTLSGYLKVWHVSRREPKLHNPAFRITDTVDNFGEIIHAKNNRIGTKVAFTVAQTNLLPDSRFFVWELTSGTVSFLEFPGRFVSSFFWDSQDSMFMALETRVVPLEFLQYTNTTSNLYLSPENSQSGAGAVVASPTSPARLIRQSYSGAGDENLPEPENPAHVSIEIEREGQGQGAGQGAGQGTAGGDMVITMFVCSDRGLLTHDMRKKEFQYDSLIGLDVPFLYFTQQENLFKPSRREKRSKSSEASDASSGLDGNLKTTIEKKLIKDFDGIDENEPDSRSALVSYVYNNLIGDVDEALKAMKAIKNIKIWENMARNCVKTQRLDVAFICLARMRNARAARAVREAETEPELEAQVAMLAIQLNMPEEAEALYLSCRRYDLLLHLYKISRQWDKAIKLCEKHCRIHLRTTYYSYGKYLESEKRLKEAIKMYESSETHRYEVPRMLVEDPQQLEAYINAKKDTDLFQWWAQYQESGGEIEAALKYYELAKDWLSLVRLLCFCGDMEKAASITEKVNDKASCYHLAKTLEDRGENHRAIHFLTKAGAYGNAIRICKENHLLDQLWSLALIAQPSDQLDAARFFETKSDRPDYDKAIQLYHRAGYASKALDLAFSTQQYTALQLVAKDLITQQGLQTDPVLLQKCADFFVLNGQVEKALDMLAAAHRYVQAMDLCVEHNLPITDEIAERLTAPKGIGLDEPTRIKLLEKIGECLLLQGNYHLAAKKYTQAGNKIQAMKSLLKSGDTEKIVFYANVCRHRDIYMMAANYLQTTNWRGSEEIHSLIVQFYTKAKAEESLAAFAASSAQMDEIGKQEKKRFFGFGGAQQQDTYGTGTGAGTGTGHGDRRPEDNKEEDEEEDDDSEELVEEEVIEDVEEVGEEGEEDEEEESETSEEEDSDTVSQFPGTQDVNENGNRTTPTSFFAQAVQYTQSAAASAAYRQQHPRK